jgi:hypothetical protein
MQSILNKLITDQKNQLNSFEQKRHEMRLAVEQTEKEILQQHGCTLSNAPLDVMNIIIQLRDDYRYYWGDEGVLLTALMRRQTAARQKIIDDMNT